MGPFYTKQEEQDKQFLAKAREVLFRNKHKFFHLPQWTTPELRRRIARIVEQRAPEPEFLKRTTTLSHEETGGVEGFRSRTAGGRGFGLRTGV